MFLETPRFPARVSIEYSAIPKFSNVRAVTAGGFDDVLIRHEQPLRTLVMTHPVLNFARHSELNHWFNAVKGQGHRFRVKDYSDFQCTIAEGVLAPLHGTLIVGSSASGYGVSTYLLQKLYTAGSLTTLRNIQKPVSVTVYRNLVAVPEGAGPGEVSIDTTTGKVTFVADQSRSISAHVVGGTHTFTLASAFSPNVGIGQRVYAAGVTGTAAATLNNLSHVVTSFGGADVTVSTATTGLTASGGTLALYPQVGTALNWVGEFDTPCRFDSDEATYRVIGRNPASLIYEWSGINLIEIRIAIT